MNQRVNYLVLFMPENEQTVDKMKVIDAWSADRSAKAARAAARSQLAQYLSDNGQGSISVVESLAKLS